MNNIPSLEAATIELSGVGVSFAKKPVTEQDWIVRGLNLKVSEQEFVVIVGPSGCGKSTLLRIIAGIENAREGEVTTYGIKVTGPGPDRGMVFQSVDTPLFEWLTVRQNIEFGLRDVAHQMADAIFEAITGLRGAFWTRIAYVRATGRGEDTRYALVIADADGHNPQEVVRSSQPLLGPAWSPDGRKLAYVNFEHGNSEIWIQDLSTGTREQISSFRGINSAPSFSPDGTKLALTLSRTGNPEIYVMELASKSLTQLTQHYGIDTSPRWSPDGQSIYFTSDRSGQPQIYQMPAGGGEAQRVTFEGRYNADPSVSFDEQRIAVTQGAGNVYRVALMDRSLGIPRWSMLSAGPLDESPSFAPNASMLVYAAREAGQGVLYAVSADGRVRQRLRVENADVRVPAWGPYRSQR